MIETENVWNRALCRDGNQDVRMSQATLKILLGDVVQLGVSTVMGLYFPRWMEEHSGEEEHNFYVITQLRLEMMCWLEFVK